MKPVMVVDDDDMVLRTVEIILRRHGWQVTKAQGGTLCLEALRGGFKGVILMDIMMPKLSGWDTIRAMQAEGLLAGNLVCMLTARTDSGPESLGLEEAVFDYLPKPFTHEALLALVDAAAECLAA